MLPSTGQPAIYTLKCQEKWHPSISRTQVSHCSMSNRRCKPAALVPHSGSSCYITLLEASIWQVSPRIPTAHRLRSYMPAAVAIAPGSLYQQAGPRPPTVQRLDSSVPAAAAMAPGSPCSNTSRPQGLHCLVGTR
jgi:hypothetical protein